MWSLVRPMARPHAVRLDMRQSYDDRRHEQALSQIDRTDRLRLASSYCIQQYTSLGSESSYHVRAFDPISPRRLGEQLRWETSTLC